MPAFLQAVALVFEHVGSAHESTTVNGESEFKEGAQNESLPRKGSAMLAQQGAANAALKLLDDLCMMVTGCPHYLNTYLVSCLCKDLQCCI